MMTISMIAMMVIFLLGGQKWVPTAAAARAERNTRQHRRRGANVSDSSLTTAVTHRLSSSVQRPLPVNMIRRRRLRQERQFATDSSSTSTSGETSTSSTGTSKYLRYRHSLRRLKDKDTPAPSMLPSLVPSEQISSEPTIAVSQFPTQAPSISIVTPRPSRTKIDSGTGSLPPFSFPTQAPTREDLEFTISLKEFVVYATVRESNNEKSIDSDLILLLTEATSKALYKSISELKFARRVDLEVLVAPNLRRLGPNGNLTVAYTGNAVFNNLPLPNRAQVQFLHELALTDTASFQKELDETFSETETEVAYLSGQVLSESEAVKDDNRNNTVLYVGLFSGIFVFVTALLLGYKMHRHSNRDSKQQQQSTKEHFDAHILDDNSKGQAASSVGYDMDSYSLDGASTYQDRAVRSTWLSTPLGGSGYQDFAVQRSPSVDGSEISDAEMTNFTYDNVGSPYAKSGLLSDDASLPMTDDDEYAPRATGVQMPFVNSKFRLGDDDSSMESSGIDKNTSPIFGTNRSTQSSLSPQKRRQKRKQQARNVLLSSSRFIRRNSKSEREEILFDERTVTVVTPPKKNNQTTATATATNGRGGGAGTKVRDQPNEDNLNDFLRAKRQAKQSARQNRK